jgi:transposase
LDDFIKKIEKQYGQYNRIWIMDRGIPTEETLEKMRKSEYPVHYLVGTPRGRLSKLEEKFLNISWEKARESVEVKLLAEDGEIYILARSVGRMNKERSIRKRKLKKLLKRLNEIQEQKLTRDQLLIKLGAAKKDAGRVYSLVKINLPDTNQEVTKETFTFTLDKKRLRIMRSREGQYLLRSNLKEEKPEILWEYYIRLIEIEQAFKEMKNDLLIRPIYHQEDHRIEAHIFISFVAYCLQVTLKQRLRALAPGLTPKAVIEKFAAIQMVDVHLPTTDGRQFVLSRYTQPEKDQKILLQQMELELP